MMKIFKIACGLFISFLFTTACDTTGGLTGNENPPLAPNHGWLEVQFIVPEFVHIPDKGLHRISLGLSYTLDSLYRGEYFQKINVSDYQENYKIILPEGEYVYEAVITCSCDGDTCLSGGFPGGQFGMKHDFDNFYIINQKTTTIKTSFMY